MATIIVFIILLILELIYFKIADKFNIIDKPNERSSHLTVTLRGGGIIFYFSILIYFLYSGFSYPWFFLGLTFMTFISFLDDIFSLSNRVRLAVHFFSVLLMAYQLNVFSLDWYFLIASFIVVVGVINAYNFMDGINGITVSYSLSVLILLLISNITKNFIDNNYLIFVILGLLVFGIFNFRIKAKAFAGDVGSVSIAFIILFALGLLIIKTENFIYILFLALYGLDSVWTIILRLKNRENIFEAHRSHLYQYLANEAKFNSLIISLSYGFIQILIGLFVIYLSELNIQFQVICSLIMIIVLSCAYLLFKRYIYNKYSKKLI